VPDASRQPARTPIVAPRPLTALLLIGVGRECERRVRAALAARDLKPRQVYVLDVLERLGPVGQRELGEMLDVDHSLLVTELNPLEAGKLIERRRSDEDRRRHLVLITGAGKRLLKQALKTIETVQSELLAELDADAATELQRTLEIVRSGFSQGLEP
jgi:MarR family transcriptional regulator, lower aerobic nicotinate degradation pathway regulator